MTLDELAAYGMVRMDDDAIDGFLSSQSVGVLGLPTDGAPYLLPMSYSYDGEDLYFCYVLGARSRKDELTERAETARFLVYRAETAFNWRSVLLTGSIEPIPDEQREAVLETVRLAWRPDVLETASETEATRLYRFRIEERSGIKHAGLPPGFDRAADERPD